MTDAVDQCFRSFIRTYFTVTCLYCTCRLKKNQSWSRRSSPLKEAWRYNIFQHNHKHWWYVYYLYHECSWLCWKIALLLLLTTKQSITNKLIRLCNSGYKVTACSLSHVAIYTAKMSRNICCFMFPELDVVVVKYFYFYFSAEADCFKIDTMKLILQLVECTLTLMLYKCSAKYMCHPTAQFGLSVSRLPIFPSACSFIICLDH